MEKTIYKKPEMQIYDIQMTKILSSSDGEPEEYSGPYGYMPDKDATVFSA